MVESQRGRRHVLASFTAYARQHLIALAALFVALGGTAYGATAALLAPNSVGTRQVIDGSLGLVDLNARTRAHFGRPRAAFGISHDGAIAIGANGSPELTSLSLPPGSYAIFAKAALNNSDAYDPSLIRCDLIAETDIDSEQVGVGPDRQDTPGGDRALVTLMLLHSFKDGGAATLECRSNYAGPVAATDIRIQAIQVARISNASD